jgi:hypothetical protein
MSEKAKYRSAESATCFSFAELSTRVKQEIKRKHPEIEENELQKRMLQSLKKFTINDQTFEYVSYPNHLGGFRWYVLCPKCRQRCLKLYLPSKYPDREQKYYCKECHRLKNSSSLLGATKKYQKVVKPLKRLDAIKAKLLKRGTTPERAKKLLAEYDRIERELRASPEYKLWEFRRKHGLTRGA